jgi:hypothetical protein
MDFEGILILGAKRLMAPFNCRRASEGFFSFELKLSVAFLPICK